LKQEGKLLYYYADVQQKKEKKKGEKHSITKNIKTHCFQFQGIVEFRAILDVPENTNPALEPFWDHRIASNGYGILVAESPEDINLFLDGNDGIDRIPGSASNF